MKRYRVFPTDFDARVHSLQEVREHWEPKVKELHAANKAQMERALVHEFGEDSAAEKRSNFVAVGAKPLSIIAFHNRFLEQIRSAFVVGAYYPALTGACALGERILNYLIITLRDDFKSSPEYKRIYNKDSFDNWDVAINTLEAWAVLLPEVVTDFRRFQDKRNEAIHFHPDVDKNDRQLALDAITRLQTIIARQFGGLHQEWTFIVGGEIYVKKSWEDKPFVRRIYLPNNCALVGPQHQVMKIMDPWTVEDRQDYEDREVSDDEFAELRLKLRGT